MLTETNEIIVPLIYIYMHSINCRERELPSSSATLVPVSMHSHISPTILPRERPCQTDMEHYVLSVTIALLNLFKKTLFHPLTLQSVSLHRLKDQRPHVDVVFTQNSRLHTTECYFKMFAHSFGLAV